MSRKKDINEACLDEIFDNNDLTPNQKDFVIYYVQSNNVAQSYLKAYKCKKQYAPIYASKLLKDPKIQSAVKKLKKMLMKSYDVDVTNYVDYLLKVANADISDYITFEEEEVPILDNEGQKVFDPDTGEPMTKKVNKMHLTNSDFVDCSVVESIKQGRDGISIQLADKAKAWEKLAKYFGWVGEQKKEETSDSGILDAIKGEIDKTWDDEDLDSDLDKTLSQD